MAKWSLPIDRWAVAAKGDMGKAARACFLEIYTRILIRSPVDTGRFRGNWMIGMDAAPDGFYVEKLNKPGAIDPEQVEKIAGYRLGATVSYRNNLPYSVALENGHSGQAPAGVVKVTIVDFGGITAAAVRKARTAI